MRLVAIALTFAVIGLMLHKLSSSFYYVAFELLGQEKRKRFTYFQKTIPTLPPFYEHDMRRLL